MQDAIVYNPYTLPIHSLYIPYILLVHPLYTPYILPKVRNYCARCNRSFRIEDNGPEACSLHLHQAQDEHTVGGGGGGGGGGVGGYANVDMSDIHAGSVRPETPRLPGEYKQVAVTDGLTGLPSRLYAWSCCGQTQREAPGCSYAPHCSKETMVKVAVKMLPKARVEAVELSVIEMLDISVFPGTSYELQMQITKSLGGIGCGMVWLG